MQGEQEWDAQTSIVMVIISNYSLQIILQIRTPDFLEDIQTIIHFVDKLLISSCLGQFIPPFFSLSAASIALILFSIKEMDYRNGLEIDYCSLQM